VPRDGWLEGWEKKAIVDFHAVYPLEGYRRLAFMMLDADVVAVRPSSVYRVLRDAGLIKAHNSKSSLKGKGFVQPLRPHDHWHVDVSYINIAGTVVFLCSLLDGCSRFIVHWEIRTTMTEADIDTIIQRARERYPDARPRIISDNGPQFIARDFKEFIRLCGMTHVRTSPYDPQSNGKIERWHRARKSECIRPGTPLSLEDAQRWARTTSVTTTNHVFTVRSVTSRLQTNWPVAPRRSSPKAIANSRPRGNGGRKPGRRVRPAADAGEVVAPSAWRRYDE